GSTPFTCTASYTAPSPSTATCSFTVTVNDTEKPTVTCPADIVVSTAAGVCSSNVTFTVSATDNCPGVSTVCNPASGSSFNKGATTVTCTASDTATPPNTATCSFTVTVNDTEKPTVTCPADIVVSTAPKSSSRNATHTVS